MKPAKGVYIRRDPSSLCGRVREFYLANPDEELTWRDVETKFDCTGAQARATIQQLRKQGIVEPVVVIGAIGGA